MSSPESPGRHLRPVEAPKPPEHLAKRSQALWAELVDEYLFDVHQLEVLRLALEALDRAEEARRIIAAEGPVYTTAGGTPRKHPAVQIEEQARIQAVRCFRELNLDVPSSDSRPPRRGGQRW